MPSLLFNQIKHDIGRLRLLIVAFVAVNLLKAVFILGYTFTPEKMVPFQWSEIYDQMAFLAFVNYFLGSLIAATFVYQDSLCDDDAFWLSRPLSPATMFTSKLIGISVVCIGIPFTADLTINLIHGFGLRSIIGTIPGIEIALLIYIPVVFIASITKSLSRLIAFITLLVLTYASLVFISDSVLNYRLDISAFGGWKPILVFVALLGFVGAIFNQYLRRHKTSTLTIALSTLAAVVILPFFNLPEINSSSVFILKTLDPAQVSIDLDQTYPLPKSKTKENDSGVIKYRKISIHGIPQDRIWIMHSIENDLNPQSYVSKLKLSGEEINRITNVLTNNSSTILDLKTKDSFMVPVTEDNTSTKLIFFELSLADHGKFKIEEGQTIKANNITSIITYLPTDEPETHPSPLAASILELSSPAFDQSITGIPIKVSPKRALRIYSNSRDSTNPPPITSFEETHLYFRHTHTSNKHPFTSRFVLADYDSETRDEQSTASLNVFDIELQNIYTLTLEEL